MVQTNEKLSLTDTKAAEDVKNLQNLIDNMNKDLVKEDESLKHEIKESREYVLNHIKVTKLEIAKIAEEAKKMIDERPPPPPVFKGMKKDKSGEKLSTLKRPEPEKLSAGQIKKVESMLEARIDTLKEELKGLFASNIPEDVLKKIASQSMNLTTISDLSPNISIQKPPPKHSVSNDEPLNAVSETLDAES